ncbi:MAG: hypothetical protein HKP40_01655 [Litoreibacter sp.]|nr:hypothetical protein [Litoreibacter sp.]
MSVSIVEKARQGRIEALKAARSRKAQQADTNIAVFAQETAEQRQVAPVFMTRRAVVDDTVFAAA